VQLLLGFFFLAGTLLSAPYLPLDRFQPPEFTLAFAIGAADIPPPSLRGFFLPPIPKWSPIFLYVCSPFISRVPIVAVKQRESRAVSSRREREIDEE
jgi:hypothetical protein